MEITLRYGRTGLDVTLPDHNVAHVLRLNHLPVLTDPRAAVTAALQQPVGSPSLAELAAGRRNAVIVVSDITRPVPNPQLLPPMLKVLHEAGLKPQDILILVATGLHRGNEPEELAEMLGPEVMASGCRIENHHARDAASHVDLGKTDLGIPVMIDRRYVEADLKILTGLVEPHLMAGYSGGRKAICPGLCSVKTVMAWHSPVVLAGPEVCAGNLYRNPVQQEALAIADRAGGADFIVNAVLNEQREITGVFAGDMREAHLAAMELAEKQAKVCLPAPVDIVVTSAAGYPLDLTFYQGVKGMVGAHAIVKEGGTVIVAQENAEGIGGPEFTELILQAESLEDFMQLLLAGGVCIVDQWQLQQMHKVLRRARVCTVCDGLEASIQRQLFVEPAASVEAAVAEALQRHGPDATIAVMPEGPYVLACLADDLVGSRTVRQMVAAS